MFVYMPAAPGPSAFRHGNHSLHMHPCGKAILHIGAIERSVWTPVSLLRLQVCYETAISRTRETLMLADDHMT